MLPEVKCWDPEHAVLTWSTDKESKESDPVYVVTGFGRRLECVHATMSVEEQQYQNVEKKKGRYDIFI
jgi:hypothetical protein